MEQAQLIKDSFAVYSPAAALSQRSLASACRNGLFAVLDRLHLYSAPTIISAECVMDDIVALSGKSPVQG